MKKNFSLPIKYEQQQYEDDRFLKLKIYVMHDKINLNNSNFEMDAIEAAKDSIKNIPILAFVKEVDGENEIDFAGHEMELVIKDDEFKFRYLGRPIGVIPADNNNYHYEIIDDLTYVVVDGYVWKDYANDALDILENDQIKSQSMEISVSDFNFSDDDICNILGYKYTGVCLLGDDTPPAMIGARAEVLTPQVFNKSKIQSSISYMLDELNSALNFSSEGGKEMEEEKEVFETETPVEENQEFEKLDEPEDKMEEKQPEDEMAQNDQPQDDQDGDEGGDDSDDDGDGKSDYELQYQELNCNYEKLLEEHNQLKESYESILSEVEELKQFKATKLQQEREVEENEVFDKFSEELTEEEMKPLREKSSEYTLEELEDKLFALAGRKKVKFSVKKEKERIDMGLINYEKPEEKVVNDIWAEAKMQFSQNK